MSDDREPMSRESIVQASCVVVGCWIYACGLTIADPDLWGHTLYGLRALQRGVLVERVDPFSFTAPGAAWVNHEWLTELLYGRLWIEWGNGGLWWWRNLVIAIPFGVAWSEAQRRGATAAGVVGVVVPTAICLSQFACFVRPQLITYALLAITLAIVVRFAADPRRTVGLWLLPLVMILWTNMHGGFLAGLGVLFVAWCDLVRRFLVRDVDARPVVLFSWIALHSMRWSSTP